MMKSMKYILPLTLVGVLIFAGCQKQQITAFEEEYSAINFAADSVSYSFLGNTTGEFIQEIPVKIMGDSASYDRVFSAEILNDDITTAQESDYNIIGGTVKAGEFEGVLKVKLYNSERLKDTLVALHLRIAESKDFTTGNVETSTMKLVWTDRVIIPTWN